MTVVIILGVIACVLLAIIIYWLSAIRSEQQFSNLQLAEIKVEAVAMREQLELMDSTLEAILGAMPAPPDE